VRLGEREAGRESPPTSIVNVARVRRIPVLLAGLLVVLALVTLVHSLLVSINGRRRDLAVLRALGADGGWIGRAVHSQATVLTIVPLLVGIPLGLLAGSVVYRAFVDRIGALPDPVIPVLLIVGLCAVLVLVANVVSVVPAFQARSVSTSQLLHEE
jgi:putative ABC transport system permease protein